ncbi:MAG TPA: DNA polymerase III subunit alpha [Candidatus Pacearchaeota archaeon]|nr:DNA polymerase III subunit alpha [Candidatus Parcubacteria bacterium]HOU46020.1 DNA polymerase III subunit alpha [Candidatus Pacearchaeota archaeon]HQI74752.1 DNA polymerase III subunit alpha [Candidatus Pacearchaeota archaeon]
MKFTHLHTHTHYSLLDGVAQIPAMLDYAKNLGMDSLAITDHGNIYGAVEFFKEAKKRGIKPIIGCEVYVAFEKMTDMRPNIDSTRYHLILLAKDREGYKNLVKLITKAHLEGFYYKPRIDEELLFKYSKGLICLSACIQGKIPQLIIQGKTEEAQDTIKKYSNAFGDGNFYLEIQHHPNIEYQGKVNKALIDFSKKLNIPLVATNDIHYLRPEDNYPQDILMMINTGTTIENKERLTMIDEDFSMRSPEQMEKDFKDVPEAISNTQKIVDACNFEFELGKYKLPHFEIPTGEKEEDYLKNLCLKGLEKRGMQDSQEAKERLEFELGVINKMGFASYFLIVQDFVNWAKNNGIVVGPGRGSAAGSIVAYLLNITEVNPFKYALLFERFLNPSRISMPDIDMDFADVRRGDVLKYVASKYGEDHVAQIITFGTIAARVSIRDVGRVLNYPYSYCDKLAKMIPMFHTLQEAIEKVEEFREIYNSDPKAKELIDLAKRIEGVVRHASTHACGVVVSPQPLDDWIPTQRSPSDQETIVTQFDMQNVEALGFLKMDFLGLRNLTVIENTIRLVKKLHNVDININNLPEDDDKTFQLLQKGDTTSVFQLESSGMKRYLKQLKPTEMEDIVAMCALYRPGPMQFIPTYIARKHKREPVTYLHPNLEQVLNKTYGLAIYQEQIMQISQVIAGFSLAEADTLRKAIGKKILTLLQEQEVKFIAGAIKNGVDKKIAKEIWEWIMPFASYGFNKSHAACYAVIAYQTAYLKAHYPTEYMCSVLNSESGDVERIAFLIDECKKMEMEILPPEINESYPTFTVVSEKRIRFGLQAIKNVGEKLVETITQERKANGNFKSLEDFLERVHCNTLNKKSMESMAKAGVFDNFEERNKLLENMEKILEHARAQQKSKENSQKSLFGGDDEKYKAKLMMIDAQPARKTQMLAWEKELLGLYVTGHILEKYQKIFDGRTVPIKRINDDLLNKESPEIASIKIKEGQKVVIGGTIAKLKKIITKNGKIMFFMGMEDLTDKIEVVVFPSLIEKTPQAFVEDKVVFVSGRIDMRDGNPKIIAEDIKEIKEV